MIEAGFDNSYYNSQASQTDMDTFLVGTGNVLSVVALKYPLFAVGRGSGLVSTAIAINNEPTSGFLGFMAGVGVSRYLRYMPEMSPALAVQGGILANMAISNSSLPRSPAY